MLVMNITSLILLMISIITMMLASILSKKSLMDREKTSPFECGFDPSSSSRLPFSLRFFLITIIFLIFDVEIALILPTIPIFETSSLLKWMMTTIFFIMILIIGLFYEWKQGALEWNT